MNEKEITQFLLKLADLGITGIKIFYEGGGDSGAIEYIGFTNIIDPTFCDIEETVDSYDADFNLEILDTKSYDAIEQYAHNTLLDNIEDWWNNEGGHGTLSIKVPSGEYHIKNHINYVQVETFEHNGELLYKN